MCINIYIYDNIRTYLYVEEHEDFLTGKRLFDALKLGKSWLKSSNVAGLVLDG